MIETESDNDYEVLDPNEGRYGYLELEGWYGKGAEHSAQVELTDIQKLKQGDPDLVGRNQGPFGDKDCLNDSYSVFVFQVVREGQPQVRLYSRPQPHSGYSGSRRTKWMLQLGLISQGTQGFSPAEIRQKLPVACHVKVSKPRQDKNDPEKYYNGNVLDVRSA